MKMTCGPRVRETAGALSNPRLESFPLAFTGQTNTTCADAARFIALKAAMRTYSCQTYAQGVVCQMDGSYAIC